MENYKKHLSTIIDLTEEQWSKIENELVVKEYKKNEFILEPGVYSEDYYFVESGVIRSYTIDDNGKEHVLNEKLNELIISLNPNYLAAQNKLIQNHVRSLQDRINLLLGASAKTRYLEFMRLYPNQLSRIPQWMIASYLGITPESLSRVRKEIAHG